MTDTQPETVFIYDRRPSRDAEELAGVVAGLRDELAELQQLLNEVQLRVERVLLVCGRPQAGMAARHLVAEIEGILVNGLDGGAEPEEFVWPYLRPYVQW